MADRGDEQADDPQLRGAPGPRAAWTVRVATWSAGHRWPLIVAWFVLTIGLFLGSQALGGIKAMSATLDGGDTLITGPVVDQAALHGLLKRVRDLGMPLVSVGPVEPGPPTTPGTGHAGVSTVKSNVDVGSLSTSNQPQQGDGE